jgi:starvation-inducible DNA-binding protein
MNKTAEELSVFLASAYTLYLKVQNYHWNIEGKEFFAVHEFTEKLYNELFVQVDDIAERIRTLGEKAPGTFREYLELSLLDEAQENFDAKTVVETLLSDYSALIAKAKEIVAQADEAGDAGTSDLLTPYISSYEKTCWMLRSFLEG